MSDRQAGRLFNAKLIRTHVCAQCGSALTQVWDESVECRLRVVCFQDHDHEGCVSKTSVDMKKSQSLLEGMELRRAYPELAGITEPTQAEIDKDMTDLF